MKCTPPTKGCAPRSAPPSPWRGDGYPAKKRHPARAPPREGVIAIHEVGARQDACGSAFVVFTSRHSLLLGFGVTKIENSDRRSDTSAVDAFLLVFQAGRGDTPALNPGELEDVADRIPARNRTLARSRRMWTFPWISLTSSKTDALVKPPLRRAAPSFVTAAYRNCTLIPQEFARLASGAFSSAS